jgi:hypothetical protein
MLCGPKAATHFRFISTLSAEKSQSGNKVEMKRK